MHSREKARHTIKQAGYGLAVHSFPSRHRWSDHRGEEPTALSGHSRVVRRRTAACRKQSLNEGAAIWWTKEWLRDFLYVNNARLTSN